MGQIADDIINGFCCHGCGMYFVEEHGFPVLCDECYYPRSTQPLATIPLLGNATEEELKANGWEEKKGEG